MSDIIKTIQNLKGSALMEAAQMVAGHIAAEEDISKQEQEIRNLLVQPSDQIPEVEELCRLLLLSAAEDKTFEGEVLSAINHTGEKNFNLSGNNVVELCTLAVVALMILKNPIKKRTTIIEDGKGAKTTTKEEYESKTAFVGEIMKMIKKAHLPSGTGKQIDK